MQEETLRHELEVLRDVSQRLQAAGIEFMLTGSLAMTRYAEPRMTRDIDLVLAVAADDAERLVRVFEPDYYIDATTVARAIARRSMFNVIHNLHLVKVDCIIRKNDAYRQEEFARRRRVGFNESNFETWIVSREDLILSKLIWALASGSEMQLRDVYNLLAPECDHEYLNERAARLGVSELLAEVRAYEPKGPEAASED